MTKFYEHFSPPAILIDKVCECVLSCLEGRDRELMHLRFKGKTLEAAMKEVGVKSKQHASIIEEEALLRFTVHIKRAEKSENTANQTPIHLLRLPSRTETSLVAAGVRFVEQLVRYSPQEILSFVGIWNAGLTSIRDALRKRDLHLSRT